MSFLILAKHPAAPPVKWEYMHLQALALVCVILRLARKANQIHKDIISQPIHLLQDAVDLESTSLIFEGC